MEKSTLYIHSHTEKELSDIAKAKRISECCDLFGFDDYKQAEKVLGLYMPDNDVTDGINEYNRMIRMHVDDYNNDFCSRNNTQLREWQKREYENYIKDDPFFDVPISLAFELSAGCSQQCNFCGFAVQPLRAVYFATPEHIKEFNEVYDFFISFIGENAHSPILYYGSEPLDNKDYFIFSEIVREKCGKYPHLTTTQHLRKREALHQFLQKSNELGNEAHRFSVLKPMDAIAIYNEYTPEELILTCLVNRWDITKQVYSGRAFRDVDIERGQSIACCFGFVVNFANHSVRLESPTVPTFKHPNGTNMLFNTNWKTLEELAWKVNNIVEHL